MAQAKTFRRISVSGVNTDFLAFGAVDIVNKFVLTTNFGRVS
jgi:hypothetical protein